MISANNRVSVGIMAFNEGGNIGSLIDDLLHQKLNFVIIEIIIVASGCTDGTERIVRELGKIDARVKLIVQEIRQGKASAINLFLKEARGGLIVLLSGDIRLGENVLERLLSPLLEDSVGMTGARPIPVNKADNLLGFGVQLLWGLHHRLSLTKPKLGEAVAFRNRINCIPRDTAVDEAMIEAIFSKMLLTVRYVPEAIVYNRGPQKLSEFFSSRERVFIGHLRLKKEYNYAVSSLDSRLILKIAIKEIDLRAKYFIWTVAIAMLEASARFSAVLKFFIFKKNPYIWKTASGAKGMIDARYP